MANQQTLQGNWNEISGKIREKWGQITDDELGRVKGDISQIAGLIQRKTGTARDEVEKFLHDVSANGGATISNLTETAREYASQAADVARENVERVSESMRDSYANAEKMVQRRPGESVAAAFGAGIVAGVALAILMRSR